MTALRWTGTTVEPVTWTHPIWRVALPHRAEWPKATSPRERRRLARAGRRGRRGSVRVSRYSVGLPTIPIATYKRHRLSDGLTDVWLYIEQPGEPTVEMCRAVDRYLRVMVVARDLHP
jgi:hypothetical protein